MMGREVGGSETDEPDMPTQHLPGSSHHDSIHAEPVMSSPSHCLQASTSVSELQAQQSSNQLERKEKYSGIERRITRAMNIERQ